MKQRIWSQYWIPLAVIACSITLLAALSFAISGFRWSQDGRSLRILFADATGIRLHSAVRYAGAVAGTVTEIRYLTAKERADVQPPDRAVQVTVHLDDGVPPLPGDVQATLSSETLLGDKFVALSAGSPDADPLPGGAIIVGQGSVAFDGLAATAQSAGDNLGEILAKLNRDYPTLIPRLAGLLEKADGLLLQSSNLVQNVDTAVVHAGAVMEQLKADYALLVPKIDGLLGQGGTVITNANQAVKRADTLLGHADDLVTQNADQLRRILADVHVVSANLKVTTTYAKSLSATLAEKPSRLIWGRRENEIPDERTILDSDEPVMTRPNP